MFGASAEALVCFALISCFLMESESQANTGIWPTSDGCHRVAGTLLVEDTGLVAHHGFVLGPYLKGMLSCLPLGRCIPNSQLTGNDQHSRMAQVVSTTVSGPSHSNYRICQRSLLCKVVPDSFSPDIQDWLICAEGPSAGCSMNFII